VNKSGRLYKVALLIGHVK